MGDPRSFMNSLPVAGGLFESLWGSPEQEAHQKSMEQAKQAMFQYRPWAMDAGMNVMNNQAAAFGPMQQLIGQMYGNGAQMDFGKIIQNPFSAEHQANIRGMVNPQQRQGGPGMQTTQSDGYGMPSGAQPGPGVDPRLLKATGGA